MNNILMRTIKVSSTDSTKLIKKILIKRCPSTSIFPTSSAVISQKNVIHEIKNIKTEYTDEKINKQSDVENEFPEKSQDVVGKNSDKVAEPMKNIGNKFGLQNQQNILTNMNKDLKVQKCSSTYESINQTSKASSQSEANNVNLQCQYFNSEYLSPTAKLKYLEQQKDKYKLKWTKGLQKAISLQKEIKNQRKKNKLEIQMYQQVISNLKRQISSSKSQTLETQNNVINSTIEEGNKRNINGDQIHQNKYLKIKKQQNSSHV